MNGAARILSGIAVASALLAVATLPVAAQEGKDWVDIKDPQELRALYSNKTFKGKDWMDRPWVAHYRADGQGILISEAGRIARTWEVKGNDQVCVTSVMAMICLRFQRHRTKAGLHQSINVANEMKSEFTVEDGVPKF